MLKETHGWDERQFQEWLKREETAANMSVNAYQHMTRKPGLRPSWGSLAAWFVHGFFVTCGVVTVAFIVFAVGRLIWQIATGEVHL